MCESSRIKIPCRGVDSGSLRSQDELLIHPERKQLMSDTAEAVPTGTTAIRDDASALLTSFELSQSNWILTVRLPGSDKMSRHSLKARNTAAKPLI
jgi:hypothetical protein